MAEEARDIENNSPHRARGKTDFSPAARMLMSVGIGCYLGWQTIDISPTLFPAPLSGVRETLGIWGLCRHYPSLIPAACFRREYASETRHAY